MRCNENCECPARINRSTHFKRQLDCYMNHATPVYLWPLFCTAGNGVQEGNVFSRILVILSVRGWFFVTTHGPVQTCSLGDPLLKNWNFSWRTMTLDLKTSKHHLLPKRKTSHEHLGIQILQDGLLVRDHLEPQSWFESLAEVKCVIHFRARQCVHVLGDGR